MSIESTCEKSVLLDLAKSHCLVCKLLKVLKYYNIEIHKVQHEIQHNLRTSHFNICIKINKQNKMCRPASCFIKEFAYTLIQIDKYLTIP